MKTFKDKLHSTCASNCYYLDYEDLPEIVRSFVERECAALVEIDSSKYTVFNPTLYIRHNFVADGDHYQLEIPLSDVNTPTDRETLESEIDSYLETDWNQGTVYIREV